MEIFSYPAVALGALVAAVLALAVRQLIRAGIRRLRVFIRALWPHS